MFAQLIRFGVVGLSGSVINLMVFALAIQHAGVGHNGAAILAFAVAVTSNFTFNRAWSFRVPGRQNVKYGRGWVKYLMINLLGLCAGLLTLNAVIAGMGPAYAFRGQALGVACGMLFNFFLSRRLVFLALTGRRA